MARVKPPGGEKLSLQAKELSEKLDSLRNQVETLEEEARRFLYLLRYIDYFFSRRLPVRLIKLVKEASTKSVGDSPSRFRL